MACLAPTQAWRGKDRNPSGKTPLVFSKSQAENPDEPYEVPCGTCMGCRKAKSREWAIRCYHESLLHPHNGFITLTYDDNHLPPGAKLSKPDLQNFLKRLRFKLGKEKLRYFACGEYGEETRRPHYHLLTFGKDFRGNELALSETEFHSPYIEDLWPYGHHRIGTVQAGACFYVAGYETKKLGDPDIFTSMSKNIGKEWALKNREELATLKTCHIEGSEHPIPKPYFEWLAEDLAEAKDHASNEARRRDYLDVVQTRHYMAQQFKAKERQRRTKEHV